MKIAIQGHPTRGHEVIQILESLGGKKTELTGTFPTFYHLNDKNEIINNHKKFLSSYKLYTLEEFEKEFPFKIGDKIISLTTGLIGTIFKLSENGIYHFKYDNGICSLEFASYLKLYKEIKEERNITLTLDKAKEWYNKGGELKEIALQAFSEKELTKVNLPKTWKEFCKNYPIRGEVYYIDIESDIQVIPSCATDFRDVVADRNICPSKKSAEAHLAMMQLEQLRDCWRQGWEPDWNDGNQMKHCVCYYQGKFKISILSETRHFLSFPTMIMAEEFLKCFRDLIEKAGDLI